MKLNTAELHKIINACYKICMNEYMSIYTDSDWSHVYSLAERLQYVKYIDDIELSSGKYYNYLSNDNKIPYRDYTVKITTRYGNITGYIRCCSAGTEDDPFSKYDMVIALWPDEPLTEGEEPKDYTFSRLVKKFAHCHNFQEVKHVAKQYAKQGILAASILSAIFMGSIALNNMERQEITRDMYNTEIEYYAPEEQEDTISEPEWEEICNDVHVTVYNATKSQCNNDVSHTACMFELNLHHPEDHKIIAMERTMMEEYDLHYGDIIKVEGAGNRSGVYQLQDTMNKRFAGQHKIDIMVDNNTHLGEWYNARIYKLVNIDNKEVRDTIKADMLPAKNQDRMDQRQYAQYDTADTTVIEKLDFNQYGNKLNEALLGDGNLDIDNINARLSTFTNQNILLKNIKNVIKEYLFDNVEYGLDDPEIMVNDKDVPEEMQRRYTVFDILYSGRTINWPELVLRGSHYTKKSLGEFNDLKIVKMNNLAYRILVNGTDVYVLKYNRWPSSKWVTALPEPVLEFAKVIPIKGYLEGNVEKLDENGIPNGGLQITNELNLFTIKNWKGKSYYFPRAFEPVPEEFKINHAFALNFPAILNHPMYSEPVKPTRLYHSFFENDEDFKLVAKKIIAAGFKVIDEYDIVYDVKNIDTANITLAKDKQDAKVQSMHDDLVNIAQQNILLLYNQAKTALFSNLRKYNKKENFYVSYLYKQNRKLKNIYKKFDRNLIKSFIKSNIDFDKLVLETSDAYYSEYEKQDYNNISVEEYLVNRFFCKLINKCVYDKPNGWQKTSDMYVDPFELIYKEEYGYGYGYWYGNSGTKKELVNIDDLPLAINNENDLYYLYYVLGYALINAYTDDKSVWDAKESAEKIMNGKEPNLHDIDFSEINKCLTTVFTDMIG